MSSLTLSAPAKLNLNLRIVRRREDGFHELATRMVPLALADELEFSTDPGAPQNSIQLTCSDPTVPTGEENLVTRAIRGLQESSGPFPGLRVHLTKRVPHGAGLGGGSSDAATALTGVCRLLGLDVPRPELERIAAGIGSDIPFFLHRCVCDCTGRGEIITPVPALPAWNPVVILIKPPFGVPTPWAYRQWRDAIVVPGHPHEPQTSPWGEITNDLERPVFQKYLVLGLLKRDLLAVPGCIAFMSGSGSTMVALTSPEHAPQVMDAAREHLGDDFWSVQTAFAPLAGGQD